jgi:PAS domain S-box-containing protein
MRTEAPTKRIPAEHPHYPISLSDLAQALDHSDEGFALTDPDGNYVYINEAHLRMYGYERPQDLLGQSWRTLYTPEWVRHFEEAVLPIMPRDLVWRGKVLGKRRNGTSFLAGVTLTLLPDGKITCNCRDESVRREPSDAPSGTTAADSDSRAVLRELGERLVAGLPAKFRRPLEMLNGYASFFMSELAAGRDLEADSLRAGLAEIDATGRRLAEQMQRLDLVAELAARDELSGRGEPSDHAREKWPQQLTAACRKKAEAAGRSGDLRVVLDDAALAIAYAELDCVVLELLVNALQSSRPGDTVQVCGRQATGAYELRVCDEGVGLPRGEIGDPVGRPFGQTAPCGFGLAVVQFILRKNGAAIEVDRSREDATCLKVTLPLQGSRRSPTPAAARSRAIR